MAYRNPLLERLADGGRALGTWTSTGSPMAAEALCVDGIDFLIADMQHGSPELAHLRPIVTAVEAMGRPLVARVPGNDAALIGRALDLGAAGVVVPMVDDAAAAARAVAASRFAPRGIRSYGPSHFGLVQGTWEPADAEQVAVIVMVETRAGLDDVRAIAATEGIAGVLIGPSDLALALGEAPGRAHHSPGVGAAIAAIRDACLEAGVAAGIVTGSPALAARYLGDGFRIVTIGSDVSLLMGISDLVAELRRLAG